MPLVYYGALCLLVALVMHRIWANLRTQSQRPIQEDEQKHDDDDEGSVSDGRERKTSQSLAAHLESVGELYVPPLSAQLLKAAWASKARATTDRAASGGTGAGGTQHDNAA